MASTDINYESIDKENKKRPKERKTAPEYMVMRAFDEAFRKYRTGKHLLEDLQEEPWLDQNCIIHESSLSEDELLEKHRQNVLEDGMRRWRREIARLQRKASTINESLESGSLSDADKAVLSSELNALEKEIGKLNSKDWAEEKSRIWNTRYELFKDTASTWMDIRDFMLRKSREESLDYPTSRTRIYQYFKLFKDTFEAEFKGTSKGTELMAYADTNARLPLLDTYFSQFKVSVSQQLVRMLENEGSGNSLTQWMKLFLKNMVKAPEMLNAIQYPDNVFQGNYELVETLLSKILGQQPIQFCIHSRPSADGEKGQPRQVRMHPYLLKCYNGRWYLIGAVKDEHSDAPNKYYQGLSPIMLTSIMADPENSKSCKSIIHDWKESFRSFQDHMGLDEDLVTYYDNAVGVNVGKELVEVILRFSKERFDYVRTKPLTPSMVIVSRTNPNYQKYFEESDNPIVSMKTYETNELLQQILSFGNHCEVLAPESLRNLIKEKVVKMKEIYGI